MSRRNHGRRSAKKWYNQEDGLSDMVAEHAAMQAKRRKRRRRSRNRHSSFRVLWGIGRAFV
jgi:hypothetical protein